MTFNETQFPKSLSTRINMRAGLLTKVTEVLAGKEYRDQKWTQSRNRFRVPMANRSMDDLHTLLTWAYAHVGRFHGFRLWVPFDYKSCAPSATPAFGDQFIGYADSVTTAFQLDKTYTAGNVSFVREIKKPVAGTVLVGVNGSSVGGWTLDATTGIITFAAAPGPGLWQAATAYSLSDIRSPTVPNNLQFIVTTAGTSDGTEPTWNTTIGGATNDGTVVWETQAAQNVTAGYEFDYPVRFEDDEPNFDAIGQNVGSMPDLEMRELKL